jgi:hypothetical protein
LARIQELLRAHPHLVPRYEAAKQTIRIFRKPAFYEVSQRCNLWCEGCYYFERNDAKPIHDEATLTAWDQFFASEVERGVSMAYFVGAETALEPERLRAAARHFRFGVIGTNGTIRIDPDIPFRVSVSVWAGDEETDKRLRGASVFRKGLKNYEGDRRAIAVYTLSPWNLDGARTVAEMCEDHGIPLTFNMFSPTMSFLDKLSHFNGNDDTYFRISRPDDSPCFGESDLARARDIVAELLNDFPETIVYTAAYNEWTTQTGPLYEIDPETRIATHCGSRLIGNLKYFRPDLTVSNEKCCTPDIDCSQCRMYSGGWATRLQPSLENVMSGPAFSDWLDMISAVDRIFVHRPLAPKSAVAESLVAAVAD